MNTELHEAARQYHRTGLPITLCRAKKPFPNGWPAKRWTLKEIDQQFRAGGNLNVGTRLGAAAKLIDIESDSADGDAALAELFDGDVPVTPTFASTRSPHRLFAWHQDLERIGKATIHVGPLEIRLGANGKGVQSLLPPSVTDGHRREWLIPMDECDPAPLPEHVLQRILRGSVDDARTHDGVNTDTQNIACVSVSLCLCVNDAVVAAIAATLPTAEGFRHRRLFHFARMLKAIPALADADLQSLRPYVQQWYEQALSRIGTKQFLETWADFGNAWLSVKYPAGQEPIRMIYQTATSAPLPPIAARYEIIEVQRLVALCRVLQSASGDKPFYLSCRTAGELLGISHVLANKWLRLLVIDNVLSVVRVGTRHRASEYRYEGG